MTDCVSQLLMLTADQIDYTVLSADVLAELCLAGDPYIAGFALLQLQERDSHRFSMIAWSLVENPAQDDDTRAFAFSLLLGHADIDRYRLRALLLRAGPELAERVRAELGD